MARNELSGASSAEPRLLYVVTEDWAFLSHRLPMARAARDAGFEVHVATRVGNSAAIIEAERFVLHPIPFARGSLSPVATLLTIAALRRVHREVKPVLTHHVALQACVLGMLASIGRPCACVNAFIGLGYSFTSETGKARAVRTLIGSLLRFLINRNHCIALVQNPDDMAALLSLGVAKNRIALIAGSGVDIDRFTPMPEPGGATTFGFVGRLLDDKGIRTLVAAHQLLRTRVPDSQLLIAGTPDPANPASVTEAEARSWNERAGITWLGQVNDIADFWARTHVAVLPSRREGLPLSLLEAAACGRAMIASDVPGCREVVVHEQTGLLFPVDDVPALADAMERLADDPRLRARCGTAARTRVVDRFDAETIGRQIVELYRSVLKSSVISPSWPMQTISAYILTYNEAEKLKAAAESVLWADEIVVIDSYSTDGTGDIATALGARVVQVPFKGFGDLRNRAIEACRCDWIFSLDADERCTAEVRDEILELLAGAPPFDVYRVPRRSFMMGRWIRGSGWYPNFRQPQLFRKGSMRYTLEPVHEGYEVLSKKPVGTLRNAIWQFPFRNLEEVLRKANRYSSLGVPKLAHKRVTMMSALGHALWSFLKHYIFKLGFIDGWAGFVIAFGNFEGTYYRYAKRYEAIQNWSPPPSQPLRREAKSPPIGPAQ